jgi:hypothetical protein
MERRAWVMDILTRLSEESRETVKFYVQGHSTPVNIMTFPDEELLHTQNFTVTFELHSFLAFLRKPFGLYRFTME